MALGFQPVLLACLASSALPVSNLTNLIAASARHLSTTAFLAHLGLPSLAATVAGWFAYRAVVHPGVPAAAETAEPDRHALTVGGAVVTAVLIGFLVGPTAGIPEWAVAVTADAALIVATRHLPLRDIPWGTALVAASLGLLAAGAAAQLHLDRLLGGASNVDLGVTSPTPHRRHGRPVRTSRHTGPDPRVVSCVRGAHRSPPNRGLTRPPGPNWLL